MKRIVFTLCALLCALSGVWAKTPRKAPDRYVIVFSLDGFRADYRQMYHTPCLDSIARAGVESAFIPSFPSLTFPNHYAMATGLYPDHSGIIHNRFVTTEGKAYNPSDRKAVEDPSFYRGEPVWNTAERQGVKAASFYWVGSETKVNGHQPWLWKKFDASVSFAARTDSVLAWLALPAVQRPHLIMCYMEEPDHAGHLFGPQSEEVKQAVEAVDAVIRRFCAKLNRLAVASSVDLIVVADHGMMAYDPAKSINLADYLPRDSFVYVSEGAPTLLYPKMQYAEKAYNTLSKIPGLTVWRKGEIPARYHYGTDKNIGALVVLPDLGVKLEFRPGSRSEAGGAAHGYDNFSPEMRALFCAAGPSFKAGYSGAPVPNVNLYGLICKLLGLRPAPNDGDESLIEPWLK